MQTVAVLFARSDSIYKALPGCDVYDIERDARRWPGGAPVVAHPPCRAWGRLRAFAKPRHDEKDLARWAVAQVRNGAACWNTLSHQPCGRTRACLEAKSETTLAAGPCQFINGGLVIELRSAHGFTSSALNLGRCRTSRCALGSRIAAYGWTSGAPMGRTSAKATPTINRFLAMQNASTRPPSWLCGWSN